MFPCVVRFCLSRFYDIKILMSEFTKQSQYFASFPFILLSSFFFPQTRKKCEKKPGSSCYKSVTWGYSDVLFIIYLFSSSTSQRCKKIYCALNPALFISLRCISSACLGYSFFSRSVGYLVEENSRMSM